MPVMTCPFLRDGGDSAAVLLEKLDTLAERLDRIDSMLTQINGSVREHGEFVAVARLAQTTCDSRLLKAETRLDEHHQWISVKSGAIRVLAGVWAMIAALLGAVIGAVAGVKFKP